MKSLATLGGSFVLLLASLSSPAAGQEPNKEPGPNANALKIRWFGQSFFQIEPVRGQTFAIDPHAIPAFGRMSVKANFVLISHPHDDHSVIEILDPKPKVDRDGNGPDVYRGVTETKTGKQEWKTIDEKRGQIRVRTVATYHDAQNGLQRGKNSVWVIDVDGLVICHLGDLGHELTAEQVKAIGKVDVLMVPIGGIYTINGEQAQAVMKQLKPRLYVLPMHYGVPGYDDLAGPEEFLDGLKNVKKQLDTNELVIAADAKADAPTVVLLGWKKADPVPPVPPKK